MLIKSLTLENWKCFKNKKKFEFENHELMIGKNGTGKTSKFEAILYAFYGKAPKGFNLNTVRNDVDKPCEITLVFEYNNSEYKIHRKFGSASPVSELFINGKAICESVREIEQHINSIIDYKIVQQLWTGNLIGSDILTSSFLSDVVLKDIFEEPNKIISVLKARRFKNNKIVNSFEFDSSLNTKEIELEIEEIKAKLKDKTDSNINLAIRIKEQVKELEELVSKYSFDGIDSSISSKFLREYKNLDKYKNELELELSKTDTIYSKFSISELKKILDVSELNNKCVICGNSFDSKHKEEILSEIANSGRSENKINELKEKISFIEKYDLELINAYNDKIKLESSINSMPNYQEVIDKYDEHNNELWDKVDSLQQRLTKSLIQDEKLKEINELKKVIESDADKLSIVQKYIEDAKNYYTSEILNKSSKYLMSINTRYKQISIYENEFCVFVENENGVVDLVSVQLLSKGEKTMVALALLFSIHSLFVPELPLLFDETFVALDNENLSKVQSFLNSRKDVQMFIITHDLSWIGGN